MSEKTTLELHSLSPAPGSVRNRKRRGQGEGSGLGRTSGRGHKGQRSRSGFSRKRGFEGGQMPLVRRIPKRGFHNKFRTEYAVVNLDRLEKLGEKEVTPELLKEKRVVRNMKDGLKILGGGELTKAIKVKAHAVTKSAEEKIKKAGGSVEILERTPAKKTEEKA